MEAEYSADVERGKDVREYLAVLRRYKWQIVAVTAVLSSIAFVVALALPPVYRSTATILVQEQEVPPDLVRSTITSYADERIQVISQQIMTRAVLLGLADKYRLYEEARERATNDEIVERMRKDVKLTTINADMSDRGSGRRVNATIAFTISYDAPDPVRAQQVVREVVSLFLNENIKARQQSVTETTAFLAQEADRVERQIRAIETKLAEFKRRNVGRLPESSTVNVQLSERTEGELQRVEREMSLLQDRKLSLEAQLALVKPILPSGTATTAGSPDRVPPSEERLQSLNTQFASSSAVYGADHPDVRRLQREIAALKAQTGATGKGDLADQRKKLEAELAALKERYGDDHPDVQRLRRSISALEVPDGRTATASKAPDRRPAIEPAQRPDNPAYVLMATQLEGLQRELRQLAALKEDLRARQRTYDARLMQIPEVEREYAELTRDYENAQTHYRQIRTKQMQAEGALELEKDQKAERFSLGEPANLPEKPFTPNRPRIALLGLLASLGSGLGLAVVREAVDPSLKGPSELSRIAAVPILTAIPYIETQRERLGERRKGWIVAGAVGLLAGAFLLGIHAFVKPVPALLRAVLGNLGLS